MTSEPKHSHATTDPWGTGPSVAARLRKEPYCFNFYQAVRVLERLDFDRQPVGHDASVQRECVRFRSLLSLSFPPSDLYAYNEPKEGDGPPHLTVTFLGLFGPSGALPRAYTELLLERARHKDFTLREFLDLFNHRLTSLFYRTWKKYHFWVGFEEAERMTRQVDRTDPARLRAHVTEVRPRVDLFSQCLLDLGGTGLASLRYRATRRDRLEPRTQIRDSVFRYFAGHWSNQHRTAAGLEGILQEYFDVPTEIVQGIGQWLMVEPEHQTGFGPNTHASLGGSAMIGARFWDLQGKFRIRLGPMGLAEFQRFLPSGSAYAELADLARTYAGLALDMEVQLILRGPEVPWCRLEGRSADAPRLGWNTWIRNTEFTGDVGDAILALESQSV